MRRGWQATAAGMCGLVASSVLVVASGPAPAAAADCFEDVVRIAAGRAHSLAVRDDGTVWAWGLNDEGQVGDGTLTNRRDPVRVPGLDHVVDAGAGVAFSAALRSDGTVWTWGSNLSGQLGNGTTVSRAVPGQVVGLASVTQIAVSGYHVLARLADGTVRGWGYNINGQLGDGTTGGNRTSPVAPAGLGPVARVGAGTHHSFAVRADGSLLAWGYNAHGQVDASGLLSRPQPVLVPAVSGAVDAGGGQDHSIVLRGDGTVWTWGGNGSGQLGDGTFATNSTPRQVPGLLGVAQISGSAQNNVVRRTDGSVWGWGLNNTGQIGDGTTTSRPSPVAGNAPAMALVAAGWNHSLGVQSDLRVWSTGHNIFGQLGTGSTAGRTTWGRVACPTLPPTPTPPPPAVWTLKTPALSPGARYGSVMAFHTSRGEAVLFGGTTFGATKVGDTWKWDGVAWTNVTPATGSPPARTGAAMAYDKLRDRTVLFGGISSAGVYLNDTWTWDGTAWTNVTPATGNPPVRHAAAAAYFDRFDGHVVLFGGYGAAGMLADTWTWNGSVWTNRTPASGGPSGRLGASMAHHTADLAAGGARHAVLYGGLAAGGPVGDTWGWNGSTWTSLPAAGLPTSYLATGAWDKDRRRVVSYGGCGDTVPTCPRDGTWTWDNGWTPVSQVPAPVARYAAASAYDTVRRVTVLFGGTGCAGVCPLGDTWTF